MAVRIVSASESATLDADTIAGGVPSRALMRVASVNAATVIAQRYGPELARGVTIYVGPGNNGGDGWCVARTLAQSGTRVTVIQVAEPATPDAKAERAAAMSAVHVVPLGDTYLSGGLVVDALLGTGSRGAPRDEIARAAQEILTRRIRGDRVVALDVPTGLDATTGRAEGGVVADLTISLGTVKRGQLISRSVCGEIVVVDIGLPRFTGDDPPRVADAAWVRERLPRIPADAHKGTRKKLTIVGGNAGMGGAAILATLAALESGIGLVRVVTHERTLMPLQARVPEALTAVFPTSEAECAELAAHTDALLIGPGLGRDDASRRLETLLQHTTGGVVLDADALTVFANDVSTLGRLLRGKPAVITPHPVEFARLTGVDVTTALEQRFDIARDVALELHAAVLLKGTPTVVTAPDGTRIVSATGTPVLAAGGSGDILGGIVATLLAQGSAPHVAGAVGAWLHGRAAERCGPARGATLDNVLAQLPAAWRDVEAPPTGQMPQYPVLAAFPGIA